LSRRPSIQRNTQAQTSDRRLGFVIFALVLLILVPGLTSILLNMQQHALMVSVRAARIRIAQVQRSVDESRSAGKPPLATAPLDGDIERLTREETELQQRSTILRTIQYALTGTLGLLGLLACWYIYHTLSLLRSNFADLDAQNRRLAGLFDTARHLSVSAPEAIHGFLTERVASMLGAGKVALWSYDAKHRLLTPLTPAYGFESEALRVVSVCAGVEDLAQDKLVTDRPLARAAGASAELTEPYRQIMGSLRVTSMLAAPLVAHGEAVGLLSAHEKLGGEPFTADDARLLKIIAGQSAFVLHSANLYARSVARGEQITALANVSASLSKCLDVPEALISFAQEARALIPFDAACIALLPSEGGDRAWTVAERKYDPAVDQAAEADAETVLTRRIRGHSAARSQAGDVRPEAGGGAGAADVAASREAAQLDVWLVRKDESIQHESRDRAESGALDSALTAGKSLLTVAPEEAASRDAPVRQAVADGLPSMRPLWCLPGASDAYELPDGAAIATGAGLPSSREPAAGSIITVPLWGHDAIFGALQLEADAPEAFTRAHLVLARQLAGQVATVVQNARLYREATRRAEQLQWGMQETHHRIKNNLQAVSAILDLHLMEAGETVSADSLRQALLQVQSIAAVHDLLNEDIQGDTIPMRRLLDTLAPALVSGPAACGKTVDLTIDAADDPIPSRIASAIALTVNELISNSIRHGGAGRDRVSIALAMQREAGQLRLTVRDDGPGFTEDSNRRSANIGLTLVEMLIERDLGGSLRIDRRHPGAEITVTVPFA
jgi:two-component sensor histidine kinase